jgi:hypothetical protein
MSDHVIPVTLREQIMQEIEEVLGGVEALEGVKLHRNLDDLLSEGNLPAIAFTWVSDELYETKGQIDHHRLTVVFRSGAKGDTPDGTADRNLAIATAAVVATKTLNDSAKSITLGDGGRDGEATGARSSVIDQILKIQYAAKAGSLTVAAG